jgi:hypothetical protein
MSDVSDIRIGTLRVHLGRRATGWQSDGSLSVYCPMRQVGAASLCQDLRLPAQHRIAPDPHEALRVNSLSHQVLLEEVYCHGTRKGLLSMTRATAELADITNAVIEPTGASLTPEQKEELDALLTSFADIFCETHGGAPGHFSPGLGIFHQISTGDAKPVTQRPYRYSHFEQQFIIDTVRKLLDQGLIRPSKSAWISPIVLVKKKTGDLRMCIDMRAVNSVTQSDPYPLPLLPNLLEKVAGCTYTSSVDAADAFWCVDMHPDDVHKTGFATPVGNFEWLRMPQGLKTASSTFQRSIDGVLAGLTNSAAFVDDICTWSMTWSDHIDHLRALFTRLRESGLRVKLAKSVFAARELKFLGFRVGVEGIRADPEKIEAIVSLPPPQSASEMRSFLGMTGFFRDFIPNYAGVTAALQDFTRKGALVPPTPWPADMQAAFDSLKHALISAPVLRPPDWTRTFQVTTDWSTRAIAAVLSQVDADGHEYVISYASRTLTPAERNYAPTEGECLALVWGCHRFRYYLHGRQFVCRTDHQCLTWLNSARFSNTKLERWAMRLQEFDMRIEHIKGEDNKIADCLSRATCNHLSLAVSSLVSRVEPSVAAAAPASYWPEDAQRQADLDSVPCSICGDPHGFDNMCICTGCGICTHLRCLLPPRTTPPAGDWFCPACDPTFLHGIRELWDPHTPLSYASHDPYTNTDLLSYLQSGRDPAVLSHLGPQQQRAVIRFAGNVRLHPTIPDWLSVACTVRNSNHTALLTCPPVEYRYDLIVMLHESLGHAGVEQTLTHLHRSWHWRGLKADVRLVLKCCDACQRRHLVLPEAPPHQEPAMYGPFNHLHVDLTAPLPIYHQPTTRQRQQPDERAYVVIMVDSFSKVAEFALSASKDPHAIAKVVWDNWFCRYPLPAYVTTDNGSEFETDFTHMLARLGISHIHTSVAHPSANGVAERLVRTFKDMLTKHVNDSPFTWHTVLPTLHMYYSHRLHSATGSSPMQMLTGAIPRLPMPVAGVAMASPLFVPPALKSELHAKAFVSIRRQFQRNCATLARRRARVRLRRSCHSTLQIGDLVLEVLESAASALHALAKGPFRIAGFNRSRTVAFLETGATCFKGSTRYRRHITRLVKYHAREVRI